jgi:hypothetical protein
MKLTIREENIKLVNEQKTTFDSKIVLRLTVKKDVVENRYLLR